MSYKYVKKPSFESYKRNIEESSPKVRKYLYKIQEQKEKKYYKQEAEIKSGIRDSKYKAKAKEIGKKVGKAFIKGVDKSLKKKIPKPKIIVKKSKMSYKVPDKEIEGVWEDENRFFKGAVKNGFI